MEFDVAREIDRVIAADHHDPFLVLGWHQIDETKAVFRTFQPHADAVRLVLGDRTITMYRVREEGLFETVADIDPPFSYHYEVTFTNGQTRIVDDPYRFLPQMSDFDRHLFNHGTLYQAYRVMGAQVTTIDGTSGVIFRVWAPAARRVSVVGDFNFWDGRVHQMRVLGGTGIWELFLPGLTKGEIYKFEIKGPHGQIIEKSDPYGFFFEMRPKSASIVWELGGYQWGDDAWLERRRSTAPYNEPISIYEVHAGSWQRDPADPDRFLSFRELADRLIPYVKEMGFTHIELLPIMEHPLDESWGYQVTGYYAVSSRFGTPQDFMYFVDQCHQNGIGVILDWVPSHFPTDGHCLGRFDGTALYEHEDPRLGHHPEWDTYIFNYGRNEVKTFLISNAMYWFDVFHVDGLRVDAVASMLYLDYARTEGQWIPNQYGGKENIEAIEFLRHLNAIVYQYHPDVMTIAEESTSFFGVSKPAHMGGLGFGFKWNMGWMNDTLQFMAKDPLYRKYHHNSLTFSLLYAFTENFILPLSHDEVVHGKRSLVSKMPGDEWQRFANLRLLFFHQWTHPGKKLLFMGGEFGQISEWYCKVSLDWHLVTDGSFHQGTQHFVQELNRCYRELPALWQQDFSPEGFAWMDFKDVDNSIVAYARFAADRDDFVVCLCNFTPQVHHDYRLGVPVAGRYEEIFNSDAQRFGGSGMVNEGIFESIPEPFGEAPHHIRITVPPLAGIIVRRRPE